MIQRMGNKILQHRDGESKTKTIGTIMHNPNVNNPAKREPFIYINGLCLTSDELHDMANRLTKWSWDNA